MGQCNATTASSPIKYKGFYKSGSSIITVNAIDATCTGWTTMTDTPIGSCHVNPISKETISYLLVQAPSAASVLPPVSYPPSGNHMRFGQCANYGCDSDCRVAGYSRLGLCVPNPGSYSYGAYKKTTVSADGSAQIVSYYTEAGCPPASRTVASMSQVYKEISCSDAVFGQYQSADSPSGLTDVSLTQLPLPPIYYATFLPVPNLYDPCSDVLMKNTLFYEANVCSKSTKYVSTTNGESVRTSFYDYSDTLCARAATSNATSSVNVCTYSWILAEFNWGSRYNAGSRAGYL